MNNPLHPEDGIVISKKWLEALIRMHKGYTYETAFTEVLENSQPLKPVLEVLSLNTAAGQWNKFPDVLPAVGSECVVITKNGTTYTSIFKDGLYWTSVKKSYDVEYWAVINKPK